MANDDFFGKFKKTNKPMSQYWRGMKVALVLSFTSEETLKHGFSSRSRINPSNFDQFQTDGILKKEFARDIPHVGHR